MVELATVKDAEELLALQKLAYQSEAELYQDDAIAPLVQTLTELKAEFANHTVLKQSVDGCIIASVRACKKNDTCFIRRLSVHPEWQNQGYGTKMMQAIEDCFPRVQRFELFTGYRSDRNLHLYNKLGYKEFKRERIHHHLTFVFLEKMVDS